MQHLTGGFNQFLCKGLVEKGNIYLFTPTEAHRNIYATVHGGMISSLVDIVTSLEIMKTNEKQGMGVSVDLNVQFLKPIVGPFTMEPRVERLGKNLIFTSCKVFNEKKELSALGRHIKMVSK